MKEVQVSSGIASHCSISGMETETRIQNLQEDSSHGRPTSSPELTPNRRTQACCFCWCCSCSRIPSKSTEERLPTNKEVPPQIRTFRRVESADVPSAEEVHQWRSSFDKVMQSYAGRQIFREFLKSEYSEENMLFWLACEDLKNEVDKSLVEEKARLIYEDYISILSPKEVSIDSRVRELINCNMTNPTTQMFDEAQQQIFTLMQRDSYPRFLNSQIYKCLLQ